MMAGPEPLMTQETNYLAALTDTRTYRVSADKLELFDETGKPTVDLRRVQAGGPHRADVVLHRLQQRQGGRRGDGRHDAGHERSSPRTGR